MTKNRRNFYLTYTLSYLVGALGTTQLIPYLKNNGFDDMQKGVILSGIALVALLSQFLFGYFSDKFKKIKIYYLISYALCTALNVLLFFFVIDQFWLAFLLVSLIGGGARCWQGVIDTWIFQVDEVKQEYPKCRAIGAVGWAFGSWIAAILLSFADFIVLSILVAIFGMIGFFFSMRCPECQRLSKAPVHLSDLKELIKNRPYVCLVATLLILFGMGCADIYLVVDKILAIEGTSFHVGLKWGLQSLAEAPVFVLAPKYLKRFKKSSLLLFASAMFGVRFLLYAWISNVWWLVAAAMMQMITFPIAMICSKELIDTLCDEKLKSTAQLAAMSVYMGISLFAMPILCNWVAGMTSIDFALLCVAAMSLLAIGFMLLFRKFAPKL